MNRILALLAGVSIAAMTTLPLHAQDAPATTQPAPMAATDDPCMVQPGADDQTASVTPDDGAETMPGANPDDTSLSATLDRCGSVLTPPAVGDPELVEPAPDTGATPVIPPSALPDDQPPANAN